MQLASPPLARLSPHYKRVSRSAVDYQSEGGRGRRRGVDARQMKMREVERKREQNVLKPLEDAFACGTACVVD